MVTALWWRLRLANLFFSEQVRAVCGVIRARAATKVIRNGPVYFRGGGGSTSPPLVQQVRRKKTGTEKQQRREEKGEMWKEAVWRRPSSRLSLNGREETKALAGMHNSIMVGHGWPLWLASRAKTTAAPPTADRPAIGPAPGHMTHRPGIRARPARQPSPIDLAVSLLVSSWVT